MSSREIVESPVRQGEDEIISYTVDVTNWGSSPGSVSVAIYDITNPAKWNDTSGTNLSGAASTASNVITTPAVTSLSKDRKYRLEVQFDISGNTYEAYLIIFGEA